MRAPLDLNDDDRAALLRRRSVDRKSAVGAAQVVGFGIVDGGSSIGAGRMDRAAGRLVFPEERAVSGPERPFS